MASSPMRRRSDAEHNYARIVEAAAALLARDPAVSVEQIAGAAGVGRATVYRHFPTRGELIDSARRYATADGGRAAVDAPGDEAGDEEPLDATDVLNGVPPHLVGEQVVAEAQRRAGVTSAALYLVDIDGSRLRRFAGSREFPAELRAPLAVGPELAREGLRALRRALATELPGSVAFPLTLRGRAIGVLLAVDAPPGSLDELARHAAVALEVARLYTDIVDAGRRRKPTEAAAELQQTLLPPRIVRLSGATLAGNVLPSYDVGGDWFDFAENPDGAWLALGDATGTGARAAALSALALSALRSVRRAGGSLEDALRAMHEAARAVGDGDRVVAALLARWHAPSCTLSWIACGHPPPLLVDAAGRLVRLEGPAVPALGAGETAPAAAPQRRRLRPGDRLLLCSDGVLERATPGGGRLGDELADVVARAAGATAAATLRAVEDAVGHASLGPLRDDATLVVLVPAPR